MQAAKWKISNAKKLSEAGGVRLLCKGGFGRELTGLSKM